MELRWILNNAGGRIKLTFERVLGHLLVACAFQLLAKLLIAYSLLLPYIACNP